MPDEIKYRDSFSASAVAKANELHAPTKVPKVPMEKTRRWNGFSVSAVAKAMADKTHAS